MARADEVSRAADFSLVRQIPSGTVGCTSAAAGRPQVVAPYVQRKKRQHMHHAVLGVTFILQLGVHRHFGLWVKFSEQNLPTNKPFIALDLDGPSSLLEVSSGPKN
jgi:hypothetical protein